MLTKSGIYQIRNTVNGKVYVGSAKILKRRWSCHRETLKKGKHHSRKLQNAWNKHGEAAFVFEPLITCAASMLLWYEQQFLDQMHPEYNISPTAGNTLGVPCSEEKKKKISKSHTGKKLSPEHREKVAAVLSRYQRTPEAIERIRAMGQWAGKLPQTREAARKRMTARNVSPETRAKISAAKKGKPILHIDYEKQRVAIAEYNRTRPITDEMRQNMSAAQRSRKGLELFEYKGEKYTVLQLSEISGLVNRSTIRARLNMGWTVEKAVTTPTKPYTRSK